MEVISFYDVSSINVPFTSVYLFFSDLQDDRTCFEVEAVPKGQNVKLLSEVEDKIKPPPNYAKWSRLKNDPTKSIFVGLMERETGSSWKTHVADHDNFALSSNGDLEIKRMDESLEGQYIQSYKNRTLACYGVKLPRDTRGI